MDRLEYVTIVPGWTLRPDNNWYHDAAEYIEDTTKAAVHIAEMPNPDNPDPGEWTETLDGLITAPENHLVIAHSLGFIATINWAAGRKQVDPSFKLGGLISVAGNIDAVGFSEIAPHFDCPKEPEIDERGILIHNEETSRQLEEFGAKMRLVRASLQYRPTVIHGKYDQFVPYSQAHAITELLDAELILDRTQAHFSGVYTPEQGDTIPATSEVRAGKALVPPLERAKLFVQMPWYPIGLAAHSMIHASYFLHARDEAIALLGEPAFDLEDPVLASINKITATMHDRRRV